jgi:hypothetical protein
MTRIAILTALVLSWSAPSRAQIPTQAVILPLETTGGYTPLDDDKLTQNFQARLHQLAPAAKLQVASSAELTAYQYTPATDQPPPLNVANTISRAYGANSVCWVSIHFQPSFEQASQTLAVAGAARVWIYDREQHKVILDQPLSTVRTGIVHDVKHAEASQKVALDLTQGCLNDLAVQLVAIAQQKQARAASWTSTPAAPSFTPSAHYQQMVHAINDYQKAEADHNYIDVTSSEQNMLTLWTQLNQQEQAHIADTYPGIAQMMNTPPSYGGYGGGYWPHYYGGYRGRRR